MGKPMIFLSDKPIMRKNVAYPRGVSYEWDGVDKLTTYVQGNTLRTNELHFQPGDAIIVTQENGVVKFSRLSEPQKMSTTVLWLIGVNKSVRAKSEEDYEVRVAAFSQSHRIEIPGDDVAVEDIRWQPSQRAYLSTGKGPWLFRISEPGLRLARYAKLTGNKWIDIAAWCSPNISREEAIEYIRKYAGKIWPSWYIDKVLTNAEMVREMWLSGMETSGTEDDE